MLHRLTLSSKILGAVLLALCLVSIFLATSSRAVYQERPVSPAETIIDSNITADTTWTLANSPYHITDNIEIEPGVTLTIEPGVEVWIGEKIYVHVREGASIIAKGTPTQHITIDRYIDPVTHLGPRWRKIWFHDNTTSYFRYVDFAYGGAAANSDDTILHFEGSGTHVLNNCQVRASKQQGIVAQGSPLNVTVAGTLFQDNGRRAIMTDSGANVVVTGSTFNMEGHIAIYLRDKGNPATITVSDSNILTDGSNFAVYNEVYLNGGSTRIDARNNWWGQASGPYAGAVTAGVDYSPWRTTEAPRAGITTPPNAAFTVDPDPTTPRPPGTVYTFDASGSTDVEDYTASLEVCWDWDNDGTCDTAYSTTKTATHGFDATGGYTQTVRLVVRDTDGDTGEATQDILVQQPPTAVFTFTQPTWAQVDFDASGSTDLEDDPSELQVAWDYQGDGGLDTGYSATKTSTYTYPHLGRYWPTLYVKDTDNLTGTLRKSVDIVPPTTAVSITGNGGTLDSVDHTVQVAMYTDTVGGGVISNGLVITHTPWLILPHDGLTGTFTYQGFNLSAQSLADGQPINEISGTYTITILYNQDDYFAKVLRLPFEDRLKLYRWAPSNPGLWTPVDFTLDTTADQLVATTDSFGDFALVLDISRVYLPLVTRSN